MQKFEMDDRPVNSFDMQSTWVSSVIHYPENLREMPDI